MRFRRRGRGQVAIVLFSYIDPSTGSYKVSVLQPMQGGSGARPAKDGIDGVNFSAGTLRNVPTEAIELEAPVYVERYMLEDEAAIGEYRGGSAVVLEFRCLAAEAIVTARGMDRFKIRPNGRIGGEPGALGSCTLNPGTDRERPHGKIEMLSLEYGDVVRISSPGRWRLRRSGQAAPVERSERRAERLHHPGGGGARLRRGDRGRGGGRGGHAGRAGRPGRVPCARAVRIRPRAPSL